MRAMTSLLCRGSRGSRSAPSLAPGWPSPPREFSSRFRTQRSGKPGSPDTRPLIAEAGRDGCGCPPSSGLAQARRDLDRMRGEASDHIRAMFRIYTGSHVELVNRPHQRSDVARHGYGRVRGVLRAAWVRHLVRRTGCCLHDDARRRQCDESSSRALQRESWMGAGDSPRSGSRRPSRASAGEGARAHRAQRRRMGRAVLRGLGPGRIRDQLRAATLIGRVVQCPTDDAPKTPRRILSSPRPRDSLPRRTASRRWRS